MYGFEKHALECEMLFLYSGDVNDDRSFDDNSGDGDEGDCGGDGNVGNSNGDLRVVVVMVMMVGLEGPRSCLSTT